MKLYSLPRSMLLWQQKIVEVIFDTRKSVLYTDKEPWVKKEGGSFDVTVGEYDAAF